MAKGPLRLVEHYVSTQGEGPRVGMLTQFIRFAGCNLKCPLWPCDSQFAIDPALYRKDMYTQWPKELTADVIKKVDASGARNLCLTGGEPFLQSNDTLLEFVRTIRAADILWEVFTNGTFEIPEAFFEAGVKPVMDWKLPGSGEQTWVNARSRNLKLMSRYGGVVKFTITDETDFSTAFQVWESLVMDMGVDVYVGAAWNKVEPSWVADRIAQFKVPWRLNIQAHNYIYGAQTRGT